MKRASKFTFSPSWKVLLTDMQIDPVEVLTYAKLPLDLFNRANANLTALEFFQFWQGIEKAAGQRDVPLLLAKHLTVEAFDAPLFAAICSPDLNTALARIQQYKPLIGPMVMDLKVSTYTTEISLSCYGHKGNLPKSLGLSEIVFFTQLARLTTREQIEPVKVCLPELPINVAEYQSYFGCKLTQGSKLKLQFSAEDACRPFLTSNSAMWSFFENNLNKKLKDLESNATTVDRVRAVLLESLPAGQSTIEQVAEKLAISKRTLQRKLTAEAESYQSVLQLVRFELAEHYLQKSQIPLAEISFLLGFREANSFIRAFTSWKGVPPGSYRGLHH